MCQTAGSSVPGKPLHWLNIPSFFQGTKIYWNGKNNRMKDREKIQATG